MLGSSKQIAELQGKITQLEADLETATTGQAALQSELNQAKADLQTALTKAGTLEASLTEATGKITKLETDLAAANQKATDAEASVETKVTERLAAAGVDPVKRDPSAKAGDDGKPNAGAGLTGLAKARAALAAKQSKAA